MGSGAGVNLQFCVSLLQICDYEPSVPGPKGAPAPDGPALVERAAVASVVDRCVDRGVDVGW